MYAFQPGEGLLQLVRVYVFAGFVDDDLLAAALHKHPVAPLQPDDVAGGVPAALQRVRREHPAVVQAAGVNELYCKDRRDAIIIFCLDRGCSLQKVNEELYRFGEKTIC